MKFMYDHPFNFYTLDYGIPHFVATAINFLNHLLIVAITFGICYRCYILEFRKTALHAYVTTLGLMLMMSEGMMVRYEGNAFYDGFSKFKDVIHGVLQITGGSLVLAGTFHKYQMKQKHFTSKHGKWGLCGCIFCAINIICGFCTLLILPENSAMRKFHGIWGLITYIVCMWTQFTSYQTGFFHRNFVYRRTYRFATFAILFFSACGPTKIALRRLFE